MRAEATQESGGFWEERTGWKQLKEVLLLEPLPGGARWAAALGSLLLFAFLVQVVTGILLAMNYAPSEKTAWPSVNYIQQDVTFGAWVRAVHHWGSSAMVILLLLHLIQVSGHGKGRERIVNPGGLTRSRIGESQMGLDEEGPQGAIESPPSACGKTAPLTAAIEGESWEPDNLTEASAEPSYRPFSAHYSSAARLPFPV